MLVYKLYHKGNIGNIVLKEAFAISLGNGKNVIIDDDENGYQYTGRIEFCRWENLLERGIIME